MKESQRKAEFEADAKRKLELKAQELQSKLDSDYDIREESSKLHRRVQGLEKEVRLCFKNFYVYSGHIFSFDFNI